MLRAVSRLPPVASWARQALCGGASQSCGCGFTTSTSLSSETQPPSEEPVVSENVRRLADEITALTVLECSQLTDILRKKLNMQRPAMGAMMPMMAAGNIMPQQTAAAAAEDKKPKEEAKKEKTEFSVKLESFSADGKIKVIKEVRAITGLGLKEAKELVEKAPVVIKPSVSKADADTMKKALEDVGGKVALE